MPEKTTKTRRLDPRAPLVLDIRELGRRPGAMKRVERVGPAPSGLGLDIVRVPEGADLQVQMRMESVVEGVLVSGTARAQLVGQCVRCLDDLERELEADFQELYVYDDRDADDETLRLDGDFLDVEPALRDAVVLALPQQPVCRPDCPGLCPECGARLADEPGHRHEVADPRWAALRGLLPQEDES